jgi:hypothetical protein
VKYPNAIGPALRTYGRVLKERWPVLLALTVLLPLVNWGTRLAWTVVPPATGWIETGIHGVQVIGWSLAWGLIGAALVELTLATVDRRRVSPGSLLRACGSALPIVALFVLATDVTSLPLTLWRTEGTPEEILSRSGLMIPLSLLSAVFDAVVLWLMVMAVPVRLDREAALVEALKESARLSRRRWRTILLVFVVTGAAVLATSVSWAVLVGPSLRTGGEKAALASDSYLWAAVGQAFSMAWMLFWPALYVAFRDQEGAGGLAETFD